MEKYSHIFDTGHIINSEMVGRSGGLLAPRYLRYYLVTENPGRKRPALEGKSRCQIGMAELVFNAGNICPGDLMIIGSVSGRNEQLIDLASGRSGALISLVYYFFHGEFDKIDPSISAAVERAVKRNILDSYLDEDERDANWWRGSARK